MGCCLSTNSPSNQGRKIKNLPKSEKCGGGASPLASPPPPLEEETVKEVVLSEIPIPRVTTPVEEKRNGYFKGPENRELKDEQTVEIKPKESTAAIKSTIDEIISEVSEHSELCSFTESFSTTTTATATAAEKRDDGEEVNQRSPMKPPPRRKRPIPGGVAGGRERNLRSPVRLSAPSPEKRRPVASRPVQGRTMPVQRRNVGPANGIRRDSGEGSARRSRSPITRGEVGSRRNVRYRSPGLGENGRPGGRSPARIVEDERSVESHNDNVFPDCSKEEEKQNDNVSHNNTESLENPLVSLECFIFL